MKSIYRESDNSMHPTIKEPNADEFHSYDRASNDWSFDSESYADACREYEKLKTPIQCSRPHNWIDGKEYEQDKDYEIINLTKEDDGLYFQPTIVPLPPIASNDEDELWRQVYSEAMYREEDDAVLFYKSKFHITKKIN